LLRVLGGRLWICQSEGKEHRGIDDGSVVLYFIGNSRYLSTVWFGLFRSDVFTKVCVDLFIKNRKTCCVGK
jgi:hypothetical protein